MSRIRKGDDVVVITGKDKGRTGKVLAVDPKKDKVTVEGVNIVTRHQRPTQLRPNAEAGVVQSEGPIHISNVMLADPKDGKPTRIGVVRENGVRQRVAKRSGTKLD
jgi:large subunit ribosomal protein L24